MTADDFERAAGFKVYNLGSGGSNGPFSYAEDATEDGYMQCDICEYHWELDPGERIWANDHRLCKHGRAMFADTVPRTCDEADWRCLGCCTKDMIQNGIIDPDCFRRVVVPPGCEVWYE